MGKLIAFTSISLDGYFTDAHGDMGWAHRSDPEWDGFVAGNARHDGMLLVPIVLGSGRTLFEGLDHRQPLQLTQCRAFSNGNVVMWHKRSPT